MTISRRDLIRGASVTAAAAALGSTSMAQSKSTPDTSPHDPDAPLQLRFAVKDGMVQAGSNWRERFKALKALGYDGIELSSPNDYDRQEILDAKAETGLPIHGVVNSIHWHTRLSDPDPEVRAKSRAGLETAVADASAYGGSSVLLVPGVVDGQASQLQMTERSITEIRKVLPMAAELGIHILIENVWNHFCYDHDGDAHQSADQFVAYIDAIDSPWVGMYFDLGNHRRFGDVEAWIRTLGRRIVKMDIKDWAFDGGWKDIGHGDVNWPAVRTALREIGYTGWVTAEVGGGDRERLATIKQQMDTALRSHP